MIQENKTTNEDPQKPDYIWLISCFLITAIATFLRFFDLGLKPFHHDEGVNGFFLTTLFRDGVYKYDPANYHGPTLYYIALAFSKVFGLETVPVRSSMAIFGVLTVVMVFFLRRYIGKIGSLFTGLFIALSPGMVFISRYFIHEILFVFLSLGIVVSVVFFLDRKKAGVFAVAWMALILIVCFLPSALNLAMALGGQNTTTLWAFRAAFLIVETALVFFVIRMLLAWNDGRPIYLLLASASAALMFATKETAFITLGTMLIACVCVWLWQTIFAKIAGEIAYDELAGDNMRVPSGTLERVEHRADTLTWSNFRAALGGGTDLILIIVAVTVVFIYINVLFFSSFFSYAEGVQKAIDAYTIWTKTGSKDHVQNGYWAYLKWGIAVEGPILILSALGILIAFIKARHRFAIFTALWSFGLFAAYTIIPYKTPWLALSFLLPMCIVAGYCINELAVSNNIASKIAAAALAISASAVLAYQTYDLNFVNYDNNDRTYIYAHTKREFLDLLAQIDRYADKSGKGKDASIEIVSPDYWPMVWYMKDYPKAIFHGRLHDTDTSEIIVTKKDTQDADILRKYSANYRYVGTYGLRPGVDLRLLVRKDLADKDTKELYRIREEGR